MEMSRIGNQPCYSDDDGDGDDDDDLILILEYGCLSFPLSVSVTKRPQDMVLARVMALTHFMELACVVVLAHVISPLHGTHGLST